VRLCVLSAADSLAAATIAMSSEPAAVFEQIETIHNNPVCRGLGAKPGGLALVAGGG